MLDTFDDFLDVESIQSFGHYLTCVCPFHESFPVRNSLFVYKDYWKCMSCNKQGADHNYLLQALNSGSTIHFEQKRFINPWNKWIQNYGSVFGACKEAHKSLKNFPQQMYYWKKRGIPAETVNSLRLGWMSGWYTIPFLGQNGDFLGAVARAGEGLKDVPKYVVPSGQDRNILYVPDWQPLENSEILFVTFGIIDAISLSILGLPAASTTAGQTTNSEPFKYLHKKIIVIPDENEETSAFKLANNLHWKGAVKILDYPEGCKDINDIFVKQSDWLLEPLGEFL